MVKFVCCLSTPFFTLEIPQHSQIAVTNYGSGHCSQRLASVVLVHGVFVLVRGVFVLVQGVFVFVHGVFLLVQGVFVLVHGVFVSVHGVLVLRSSFLGVRFRNTPTSPKVTELLFVFALNKREKLLSLLVACLLFVNFDY